MPDDSDGSQSYAFTSTVAGVIANLNGQRRLQISYYDIDLNSGRDCEGASRHLSQEIEGKK